MNIPFINVYIEELNTLYLILSDSEKLTGEDLGYLAEIRDEGVEDIRGYVKLITDGNDCEISGHKVADHFVDVNKMVSFGSGSQREQPQ